MIQVPADRMDRARRVGYGHATRVSAFACHLLRLDPKPIVHIVSSAPKHVFSDSIALGGKSKSRRTLRFTYHALSPV